MTAPTSNGLRKTLRDSGLEIYRSSPEEIVLAERVRENLLMDSGVVAKLRGELGVRLVLRAQAGKFPGEAETQLFARARRLADAALGRGYREVETRVVPIEDPGDQARTLDTWCEVWLERGVGNFEELLAELRHALSFERTA